MVRLSDVDYESGGEPYKIDEEEKKRQDRARIIEEFNRKRKFIQRGRIAAYTLATVMVLGSMYFLDNKPKVDRVNPFYNNDISRYDSLSALANSVEKAKSLAYKYFPKDSLDNAINLMKRDIESIKETENLKLYQKRNSDLNRIILYAFLGSIVLYLGTDLVSVRLNRRLNTKEKEEQESLEKKLS